jgi:hypothetical protein
MQLGNRAKRWLTSFGRSDPRSQIKHIFSSLLSQVDTNSSTDIIVADQNQPSSPLLSLFSSSVFTIWQPTSVIAIQCMMAGEAIGKGLKSKGKSSKAGNSVALYRTCKLTTSRINKRLRRWQQEDARVYFTINKQRERERCCCGRAGAAASELDSQCDTRCQTSRQEGSHVGFCQATCSFRCSHKIAGIRFWEVFQGRRGNEEINRGGQCGCAGGAAEINPALQSQ